jgi:hypothetical protein
MADKLCNRLTNTVNPAILLRRKPECPLRICGGNSMGFVILLQELVYNRCLSAAVAARYKYVGWVRKNMI